jgi:hypothetical protein
MHVDPANATELANIAREAGGEVLEGARRYPSETGTWQPGDVDLGEYLDTYRGQRLMVVFVPLGEAEAEPVTCSVCGFIMDKLQECPRCKLEVEGTARELQRLLEEREQLFEGIDTFLQ